MCRTGMACIRTGNVPLVTSTAALHAVLSDLAALRCGVALIGCPLNALRPNDRQGVIADFVPRTLWTHLVGATDIPAQYDAILPQLLCPIDAPAM